MILAKILVGYEIVFGLSEPIFAHSFQKLHTAWMVRKQGGREARRLGGWDA
jgi:predicted secreted protein